MDDHNHVPFCRPYTPEDTIQLVRDSIQSAQLSGDGPFTEKSSRALERITGAKRALLTPSCTDALEICALLMDIKPGDEIILPSFTFVSTANAFALRGARLVFVDIRPDTFNIDEHLAEKAITDRTKAIVLVHYGGVACQLDMFLAMAKRHGIRLVEDNAHGLGGYYDGRPLGSFGDLATLSFHQTKNIQCGEGGALLINDTSFLNRAQIIREKGTNRTAFLNGSVDKYTWVDVGSSYLMSDILASYLYAQLKEFQFIQTRRMKIWSDYATKLTKWARTNGFEFQICPEGSEHPAHLFAMTSPDSATRGWFLDHLAGFNVNAVSHYVPLHSAPIGKTFRSQGLPVTDRVASCLIRLPISVTQTDHDTARVIDAVTQFST